jgi:inosine-uridine nucleoside N-ribohydrolase
MSQQSEPLVIDVDTGIDDAFALLYACAHDEAQILGVSTVVGNVSLAAATRNTRAVLALAGRGDIPVWPGAATAISIAVKDASEIHGRTGLGHAILPEPDEPTPSPHAADSIIGAARAHPGRLILCAVGPRRISHSPSCGSPNCRVSSSGSSSWAALFPSREM